MGWWSTTQIDSMKDHLDRANCALKDFDLSYKVTAGLRENILVHSLKWEESVYPKMMANW